MLPTSQFLTVGVLVNYLCKITIIKRQTIFWFRFWVAWLKQNPWTSFQNSSEPYCTCIHTTCLLWNTSDTVCEVCVWDGENVKKMLTLMTSHMRTAWKAQEVEEKFTKCNAHRKYTTSNNNDTWYMTARMIETYLWRRIRTCVYIETRASFKYLVQPKLQLGYGQKWLFLVTTITL